ncbi:queuosine biosynthesis protein QueD [Thermodesulfobacterium geofontis OPF15]|jgi:6-pyruvoyltetrahydropterin/6-carboxytetrahydropterin synthase|uniref:6-carboxy-5,6,7,8-tetrahydropterin synthase n=1 Tax=Thermodesulfobacterium geofontis (strain OPF15) TaxID=795359 RepID=F8C2N0_THEGP|nr:6-carboxytetrahydropterin synthase QueD [Thermodesulfobacterium geofontis]AEH23427.1 queuosine biosynthesis protein QueD [Thermodesulfobacterium geofontis OPF15]
MFKLKVQDYFSSAHYLKDYKGPCEKIHGHNWKVELIVEGSELNSLDILIDFAILKKILKEVLFELDHKLLNEIPYFENINPSSERLAEYIFKKVKEKLSSYPNVKVKEVTVFETEKAGATYYE